jgi:hypothetical protein
VQRPTLFGHTLCSFLALRTACSLCFACFHPPGPSYCDCSFDSL